MPIWHVSSFPLAQLQGPKDFGQFGGPFLLFPAGKVIFLKSGRNNMCKEFVYEKGSLGICSGGQWGETCPTETWTLPQDGKLGYNRPTQRMCSWVFDYILKVGMQQGAVSIHSCLLTFASVSRMPSAHLPCSVTDLPLEDFHERISALVAFKNAQRVPTFAARVFKSIRTDNRD